MGQAAYAAGELKEERDSRTGRLIETAMAVAYMRPFTSPTLKTLRDFVPQESGEKELHAYLEALRHTLYAHTDEETDRKFFFSLGFEDAGEDDWVPYGEMYTPFPNERLDDVIALCHRLRDDMLAEARRTWIALGRPREAG